MYIKNIKLNHYRNYEACRTGFSKSFNIIYGDNAQGKTNILEAIFLCASGRSHRTSKDADLIKMGHSGYFIEIAFEKEERDARVEISYQLDEKKKIKVNEIPVKKLGSLMGHLNAVIFSPEDLLIIKEGPAERRRFIDITISQLKPAYFYDLQQYIKVLYQRNTLLKDIQKRRAPIDTLEVWNTQLVTIGSRIMRTRFTFIERLSDFAAINHGKLTQGKESLLIKYSPSIKCENYKDIQGIETAFKKALEESLQKELQKTSTLVGPQRDDYEIILNEMNIKQFGSQGQQRTAILSVKLSEVDLMKEDTGEYPVILLDDVMSELDSSRQEFLIHNLKHIQTFITSTDYSFLKSHKMNDIHIYHVESGEISIE